MNFALSNGRSESFRHHKPHGVDAARPSIDVGDVAQETLPRCRSALVRCRASAVSSTAKSTYGIVERVKGIEPSYEAWEAAVLPLNYTRKVLSF